MTSNHITPEVRIKGRDDQRAQAAAMAGMTTHKLFTYLQPYDLRRPDQYAALAAVYRSMNRECPVTTPGDAPVRYLLIVAGEPFLLPEADVPPFVLGAAAAKLGVEAAKDVLYAEGILS